MEFAQPVSSEPSGSAAEPSGLTAEHKIAMNEAFQMRSAGQSSEAAVDHLTSVGMPRVVAKVLMNQYDRNLA